MGVVKKIDLKDLGKELNQFSKLSIREQKVAVANGVAQSIPDLVKASPVDTGQYASSWDFNVTTTNVILGNFAPHAPIIEFGARPFKPPLPPLLAWAKRVLQDPSQPPDYSDAVWALAVGTQKKIQRQGMRPRRILTKTIPVILKRIQIEVNKRGS